MRGRLKALAVAAGAIAAIGVGAGAVAATSGGGDPATDLANAINKRAGTSITSADVQGAFQDLLKQRLDADVAAGRLTQAQEDQILKNAQNGGGIPFGGGFRMHLDFGGPRAEILAPVAKLLNLTEAQLKAKLRAGTSLTKIAAAQGVSKADLVATIKKQLTANVPQGAQAPTDAQLTDMATHIADGDGPRFRHHDGPDFDGDGPHLGPPPAYAPPSGSGSGSGTDGSGSQNGAYSAPSIIG